MMAEGNIFTAYSVTPEPTKQPIFVFYEKNKGPGSCKDKHALGMLQNLICFVFAPFWFSSIDTHSRDYRAAFTSLSLVFQATWESCTGATPAPAFSPKRILCHLHTSLEYT